VPDSVRLIDPTLPAGVPLIQPPPNGWFDPEGIQIAEILNHEVNFGWEYVWHCHILAHEEMDMMHSLVFAVPPMAPSGLAAVVSGPANDPTVTLSWTDNSLKEAKYTIQRAANSTFTTGLTSWEVPAGTVPAGTMSFADTTVVNNVQYAYRVLANSAVFGDTQAYLGSLGFPTMTADAASDPLVVPVGITTPPPANPTSLTGVVQAGPQVTLTWTDNATDETGFVVERCTWVSPTTPCSLFTQVGAPGPRTGTGTVTFVNTGLTPGATYTYRVWAINGTLLSVSPTNNWNAVITSPAVPTFLTAVAQRNGGSDRVTLTWGWPVGTPNPTSFRIERATNATFTQGLTTVSSNIPGANRTYIQNNVPRNRSYYYRIRANMPGGNSAFVNATPFPVITP
jgi:hypothetical protein